MGNVMRQSAQRRMGWWHATGQAESAESGIDACKQARSCGIDITFDAGELPSEKEVRIHAALVCFGEHCGSVEVGVAVDPAVADEFGILQSGDHPEYAL